MYNKVQETTNLYLISVCSEQLDSLGHGLHRTHYIKLVILKQWEDNVKMDLREIGFGDMDWIHWAQDRDRWRALVKTVINLWVP
jgi:hypothetical protein